MMGKIQWAFLLLVSAPITNSFSFVNLRQQNHHHQVASQQAPIASATFCPSSGTSVFPRACRTHVALHMATETTEDLPSIQALFNKYCDDDGLMTKATIVGVAPFNEMLADGDLVAKELDAIWDVAPKFPDVSGEETRIDVDSFVQIYRDVDDLFEEDGDDTGGNDASGKASAGNSQRDDEVSPADDTVEAELEGVFESICDKDKLVSKNVLFKWEEMQNLLKEGLLGEDEFDELWQKTKKIPGASDQLDVDGFLSFNVALDSLFEFEDDDEANVPVVASPVRQLVQGDDLPPAVLFSVIAGKDLLVGMEDLKLWGELQDMLEEGDLSPTELETMYNSLKQAGSGKLDEGAFVKLYEEVDALFEDEDDEEQVSAPSISQKEADIGKVKSDLLSFLSLIEVDDDEVLPCGLDSTDAEQKQVLNIVRALESQKNNLILVKKGEIEVNDLVGTWELLFSSSSAMKFNNGLSGLGGSVPNGRFQGVKQKLTATKFIRDVEYTERIEVNPSSASFDVQVIGNWDLRTSVSLFTGQPSIILNLEPDRVNYGPTSTRADHWKSLGPLNMLDVTYLDDDLRVMRGCTSTESIFIWKRIS